MMSDLWAEPIVANLLTGFLGAGKTSLLNRLLRRPELADAAVLINEFGEISVDHLLVEKIDEDIVLLATGCVCCTIRGELKEALTQLFGRRQRGEIPPFTRIVIETTGLADPVPILATLAGDPALSHHFVAGNVVTVVDAENGAATLDAHDESRRQVAVADRLVVSKTDIASADRLAALTTKLVAINPAAGIVLSREDEPVSASLIVRGVHDDANRPDEVRRWFAASGGDTDADQHGSHDRRRHGDIRAMVLRADQPIDWAAFGLWLSMLLNRYGGQILRVKGLLDIAGRDAPVVVQGVQHLIHKPVHLDRWPTDDRRTGLVFILRGLDPERIEASFNAFMRLASQERRSQEASA
jgi:G3E family GTPase